MLGKISQKYFSNTSQGVWPDCERENAKEMYSSFTKMYGNPWASPLDLPASYGVILYYISLCLYVCMYVCYRFSRQLLNRSLWNLSWCFEMESERQLSILVPIGCIFSELWHNKGGLGGSALIGKWNYWRNNTMTSLMKYLTSDIAKRIPGVTYKLYRDKYDELMTNWHKTRGKTGDRGILTGAGWRTTGVEWWATNDGRQCLNNHAR